MPKHKEWEVIHEGAIHEGRLYTRHYSITTTRGPQNLLKNARYNSEISGNNFKKIPQLYVPFLGELSRMILISQVFEAIQIQQTGKREERKTRRLLLDWWEIPINQKSVRQQLLFSREVRQPLFRTSHENSCQTDFWFMQARLVFLRASRFPSFSVCECWIASITCDIKIILESSPRKGTKVAVYF